MKIKDIQLDNRNANKGTARGQKQIVGSIQRNGFGRSGLLDKNGKAIAGNKTTEAAAEVFGVETEPIIVQTDGKRPVYVQRTDLDLDDPDPNNAARRLAYEDNLASHFSFQLDPAIVMADIEAGFNFEAIDITLPDLGEMLEGAARELLRGNGQLKDAPPQIDKAAQLKEQWGTATGQVWEMPSQVDGRPHRIVCGDCTDRAVVEAVMKREWADTAFTDPPYNVGREYTEATNDNRTSEDYQSWTRSWVVAMFGGLDKDADIFVTPGHRYYLQTSNTLCEFGQYVWTIAWIKTNSMMRSPTGFNTWEPITWIKNGAAVGYGNKRYDTLNVPMVLDETTSGHPTPKPVNLLLELFKIKGDKINIVLDSFLGSGTTLIAAHNLHRIARGIEIDPGYVAVTLQRYQDATGIEPRLLSTDSTL